MVFGRKPTGGRQTKVRLRSKRPAPSYHRPVPPDNEITNEATVSVSVCRHCGGPLHDIEAVIRYVEDIILASLADVPLKTATKRTIERGYCTSCGVWTAGADLRGEHVMLGPNVRLLMVYLAAIQGLTYEQIKRQLMDLYRFPITDGEIEVVLARQRTTLLPVYQQLKDCIRAGPAHFDETTYPIQAEQGNGYAWVMAGADSTTAEHNQSST